MNDTGCVLKTVKIIGSKWTIPILSELCAGTRRFGQLERALKGISPKTLSLRLKELEKHGIINKRVFNEVPLHVEYSLTEKGRSLRSIVDKMHDWGAHHANLRA